MLKRNFAIPIVLVLALTGCGDKKVVPFLGQWEGHFQVNKVGKGSDTAIDRKQYSQKGYVSVRLNKHIYTMHLEGEQQQLDIKGTWSYSGQQITLEPTDIKVNDDNGDKGPNPNLKYVPSEDLYNAYQKKITLKLSPDGSTLQGLTTTRAFLEGVHIFKKP